MTHDVLLEIRPDTPNPIQLVVDAVPGQEPRHLERQSLPIANGDLDKLMAGAPSVDIRRAVETAVTDWLLAEDLRSTLTPALTHPVRIVIDTDRKYAATFANVPFELARWDEGDYLLLKRNLMGIVYAAGTAPLQAPAAQSTTFRVLVVRAEPNNLAGTVPLGVALRDKLRAVVPELSRVTVEIRLLSREAGADGPATYESIRSEVKARPPSALLYLGHGDLLPGGGGPPSPVLLVERPDGEQKELSAASLRQLFKETPVPLVALAGCLTAAAPQTAVNAKFGQSMAQFLVSGEAGVTVAIGMRYRVDVEAAMRFLEEMLRALLDDGEGNGEPCAVDVPSSSGNADLAVKAARCVLYGEAPSELGWAAPVVYRRVTSEPLFPQLLGTHATPTAPATAAPLAKQADDAARAQLAILWTHLASLPENQPALVDTMRQLYETIDGSMRRRLRDQGVIGLVPVINQLVAAPSSTCKLTVELTDPCEVRELKFDLVLRGAATWKIQPLPRQLKALGVQRFVNDDDQGMARVELRSDSPVMFPAGTLCEAEIALGSQAPSVVEASVTAVQSAPPLVTTGWVDAVAVRLN